MPQTIKCQMKVQQTRISKVAGTISFIQVIMNLIYFLQRANLEQWFHDSSQRENDDEVSVTEALLLNAYFWGLQGRDAVWGQPKRSQMLQGNRTTLQQFLKIMPGMKRPYSQYALLSTCRIRIISEAGRRCFSGACRLWRVLPAQRGPISDCYKWPP